MKSLEHTIGFQVPIKKKIQSSCDVTRKYNPKCKFSFIGIYFLKILVETWQRGVVRGRVVVKSLTRDFIGLLLSKQWFQNARSLFNITSLEFFVFSPNSRYLRPFKFHHHDYFLPFETLKKVFSIVYRGQNLQID